MSWSPKIFVHKQESIPAESLEQHGENLLAAIVSSASLAPNSVVPKSGLYRCSRCGVADPAMRNSYRDNAQQTSLNSEVIARVLATAGISNHESITYRRYSAGEHFGECPWHKKSTGWTLENEAAASASSPVAKPVTPGLPMMECSPFHGKTFCADNECPCDYTTMPPAKGYLWITPEVAGTRMTCLSLTSLHGYLKASAISGIDEITKRCFPLVVCEQAAKRRNLNLEVASSDFDSWVKTGKVPCRATPLVSSLSVTALKIGDEYGGGIVFYTNTIGRRHLIAARRDVPQLASILDEDCFSWYDAKTVCRNLVIDGYRDWFLPDKEELNQLYLQRNAVGGFADDIYWSSTECDANYVWTRDFGDGGQNCYSKDFSGRVRAVRSVTY